jgi:hypothetical protein
MAPALLTHLVRGSSRIPGSMCQGAVLRLLVRGNVRVAETAWQA